MKTTTALKTLLLKQELSFLMESHNALSARIAEESGFEGLWASGLSIAASMGLTDRNEASWTQILEVVDFMTDCTTVPVLLDGDTGFGNFNNVRRLVKKLSQRHVAGVCLEDKLFPKTNSFIGAGQPLADVQEFCGKIKAAKDSQLDDDFCVVARVEALVSGLPMEDALMRARAYADAGADAILIHSKQSDGEEVLSFCHQWERDIPIVIVPTKYYQIPTDRFEQLGVSTVIWANHSVRAAISAIRSITRSIRQNNSVAQIEQDIATLDDIFNLTSEYEHQKAEQKYLPA
ncbi:phosphoenolpyruvate mutase [Spartinivicinus poritis]|uniref:phosphoenolpyruvate mutase n=1 Tax=Spartinivicinus poritis TaxID=2994640 RepID=A0ABT5U7W1_9GAMM|nr:phosphoenolpyruvate mutase [Spartinivicinus sp. A2-2]MDE1462459.1 phosphoenolpyruvate mutase [Spartinivicinus sp. A2-2]